MSKSRWKSVQSGACTDRSAAARITNVSGFSAPNRYNFSTSAAGGTKSGVGVLSGASDVVRRGQGYLLSPRESRPDRRDRPAAQRPPTARRLGPLVGRFSL